MGTIPFFSQEIGTKIGTKCAMAFLQKRGKVYYARFTEQQNGKKKETKFSLKTTRKEIAERRLQILEEKHSENEFDPFVNNFDLLTILIDNNNDDLPYDLDESLKLFIESRKHRKKITRDNYKQRINYFLEFCDLHNKSLKTIQKNHFVTFLYRPGIRSTTRYTDLRHLRAWWHFMMKKKWVKKDLLNDIELPERDATIVSKMISEKEITLLFKTFDDHIIKARETAYHQRYFEQSWFKPFIMLLIDAGLRLHEALYNPEQADLKEDNYTGLKGRNIIGDLEYIYIDRAKRHGERMIPISSRLRSYLKEYFAERGIPEDDEFVFITYRGFPLNGHHARKEFKKYLRMAGIPTTRTFHGMRHRAITTWLEDGFTLSEAKDMAGHSSVKITDEVYTHLAAKNLKRKMEEIERNRNSNK